VGLLYPLFEGGGGYCGRHFRGVGYIVYMPIFVNILYPQNFVPMVEETVSPEYL
jgi:hypothetical protein